jgi:hypothetical protein
MFGFGRTKEEKAQDAFSKSPLGRRLQNHNLEFFGEGKIFGKLSEEAKNKNISQFYERVFGVFNAENPFMQMRLELCAQVISYSQFIVLLKSEPPDGLQSPYVSGDLYKHIAACAPHNEELAEEIWRQSDTSAEELLEYARVRSIVFLYFMNGMNILRSEFDDVVQPDNKDWYRPFVKSMMIVSEDHYRSKINLPTLLEDKILRALPYSTFMKIVQNGMRNPLFDWEQAFGEHAKTS